MIGNVYSNSVKKDVKSDISEKEMIMAYLRAAKLYSRFIRIEKRYGTFCVSGMFLMKLMTMAVSFDIVKTKEMNLK